ncbi:MAG: pyruvate dehydrogenase (acetyl-transferring) E1 component subunit alpha [Armatimonadota bacterium]
MDKSELIEMYRQMVLIRKFEERAGELYKAGKIGGFLHLYIGQEAVAVGFISSLKPDDYVISAYREHGQALTKGIEPRRVMAELYGKRTGVSRGKGGSMHMFDVERHFMGGDGIVGSGMPLATGMGFAINYRETDQVCLCFFGDGAVNEGAFHESLNLASLWNLPVLYVCENNFYGMGTAVNRASSIPELFRRAQCYDLEVESIDGMDLLTVKEAAERGIRLVRRDKRPRFIEAVTYRYRGHSIADPGTYRTKEEIQEWEKRDPIPQFANYLLKEDLATQDDLDSIDAEITEIIDDAVSYAEESHEPTFDELFENVYA